MAEDNFDYLEWLTPQQMLVLTGLPPDDLKALRQQFTGGKTRGTGVLFQVHQPSFFQSWHAAWKRGDGTPIDPLERKRHADAELAEIKVKQALGRLVDVDEFCAARLDPFCDELRKAIELIYPVSAEAAQILDDGLEAAKARLLGHGVGKTTG